MVVDYTDPEWPARVMDATNGKGIDLVFEAASGAVGKESLKLAAPFGQIVMYGAKNIHDTLSPETIQQLIYKNQTLRGFNLPSLPPYQIADSIPHLLQLIDQKKIQLFADTSFPLAEARTAFRALAGRSSIGKVVLIPAQTT